MRQGATYQQVVHGYLRPWVKWEQGSPWLSEIFSKVAARGIWAVMFGQILLDDNLEELDFGRYMNLPNSLSLNKLRMLLELAQVQIDRGCMPLLPIAIYLQRRFCKWKDGCRKWRLNLVILVVYWTSSLI